MSTLRDPAALALAETRLRGLVDSCNQGMVGHNAHRFTLRPPQPRRRLSTKARIKHYLKHPGQWRKWKRLPR